MVDIGLRTTADDWIEVATLQGRPLVLFMFATFDGGSQAMLRPLRGVVARRQNILFVGIAAQPRAEALLDAWAYALNPPFVVAFDPTDAVQKGLTALGELESVPALIFVGADGYERGRLFGVQQERVIDAWLDKMLRVKQAPAQQR